MRSIKFLVLFCSLFGGSVWGANAPRRIVLEPCHLENLPEEVRCGTFAVPEDRGTSGGRSIQIHIAVLPALRRTVRPDPLFIMAGGPGQGARSYGALVARSFREVRRTREIVLVDLRGTGDSAPLICPQEDDEIENLTRTFAVSDPEEAARRAAVECAAALSSDPRHFTHANALADLDDVRQALGYGAINLWGGSWGTRAALLYAMRYPAFVRSLVLDGAVPLGITFPDSAPHDGQRALDKLLVDCELDNPCNTAFPRARVEIADLLAQFDAAPRTIAVRHPRTDARVEITITRDALAEMLRATLYSPVTAGRLPSLVRKATEGDFAPVVAQWLEMAASTTETMALGATMSILCSEDVTEARGRDDARARVMLGDGYQRFWRSRCRHWPAGPPLPRERETLAVPALILSGELDPVTPPRWGTEMTKTLNRHAHVVVPGAAHNVSFTGCVPELIARFLANAQPEGLDAGCATTIRRPPFVVNSAGSQP
jgi:pimeloyl-ACP methyl ester carboxylesterase